MVVHDAGLPVNRDWILDLGYPVIENAAHSTGEGGGLTSKHPELIETARILSYCGIGKSEFESAMSDIRNKSRWWRYKISEPLLQ